MKPRRPNLRRAWVGLAASVALACCAAGCGSRTAQVSGKVTYNNQPVGSGSVNFFGPGEATASAPLQADGSYEVLDAPVGEVTITVVPVPVASATSTGTPMPRGMGPMRPPGENAPDQQQPRPAKPVRLPDRYKSRDTSPLRHTLHGGEQVIDLALTP